MTRDVETWITNCNRCIRRKKPTNKRAALINIESSQPLELVCMDYLSLERSKGGYENILVITDHFTRYAIAIPTRTQTAKTTAEAFFYNFIVHYGLSKRIHSDQGANFESKIIKELCNITGMGKSRTTHYHPMENGMTERFNRTLLNILGTLDSNQKKDWKLHVAGLVHVYSCTRQPTTGLPPYFLMFGRTPRSPVEITFGLEVEGKKEPSTKYVETMKERLKKAYELASRSPRTAQERQKSGCDKKVRRAILQPGDRVLVKIVAFDAKHKIADKWEEEPYGIVSQPNRDILVYVVQRENGEGRKRTLHRNLLLPIGFLPEDENSEKPNEINPAPKWQRLRKPRKKLTRPDNNEATVELESDVESDEESEQEYYMIYRPGEDPQNNTNSDAHHVDSDQARTINFTDDDHVEVDRGQGTSFVEYALPSADMNDTDESTSVSDDGITVEAVGQNTEHISDVPDDSALTDPSLEEPVLHTHFPPEK
jgi:transposase InsO family protein